MKKGADRPRHWVAKLFAIICVGMFVACSSEQATSDSNNANPTDSADELMGLDQVSVDQLLCSDPEGSEDKLRELKLDSAHGPIALTEAQQSGLREFIIKREHKGWCHDRFRKDHVRLTGPIARVASRPGGELADIPTAFGTHARVRVYYSNSMVEWLRQGRQGPVPDGAMMVKEMFPSPTVKTDQPLKPDGHAVMYKDSLSSREGWLWYLRYPDENKAYKLPFEAAQYGAGFCMACHAAADGDSTFAAWGNLIEEDVPTYIALEDPGALTARSFGTTHGSIPREVFDSVDTTIDTGAENEISRDWDISKCKLGKTQEEIYSCLMYVPINLPTGRQEQTFVSLFERVVENAAELAKPLPLPLPMDGIYDHRPPPPGDPDHFATATVCSGCHDASDLVNGTNPEMSVAKGDQVFDNFIVPIDPNLLALSPTAEWSGSLMSVSARDPVFRAQLEWETTRYPQDAETTTQFCLSCHAPLGERRHPGLATELINTTKKANTDSPAEAEFGALARDGVTCSVCHHISAEGLGEEESFNAQFKFGPADEMYGPFEKDLQVDPMHAALGAKPVFAKHISDSGLCGSCHVVNTPVLDNPEMEFAHEQTTYLEWKNSAYAVEESEDFQSCQGCHMQNIEPVTEQETLSKIANYEDSTFPFAANRKASPLTDTVKRKGYRRHTLTGLNLFTMGFFQQFAYSLGSSTFQGQRAFQAIVPPRALATFEVEKMATTRTADVRLENVQRNGMSLHADVLVQSKVGHKFPTGVGFRRAFLEVALIGEGGVTLWCSGCTDATGVILDGQSGQPLSTEFPMESNAYQPDYKSIDSAAQVQIYETRHVNAKEELTTSFVELDREVKDNRILPKGWRPDQYESYAMQPVAASATEKSELDRVQYRIPIPVGAKVEAVSVRLFYQALPPYYLLDRVALLDNADPAQLPETQRLLHYMSRMNVGAGSRASELIKDWKLQVGQTALAEL